MSEGRAHDDKCEAEFIHEAGQYTDCGCGYRAQNEPSDTDAIDGGFWFDQRYADMDFALNGELSGDWEQYMPRHSFGMQVVKPIERTVHDG